MSQIKWYSFTLIILVVAGWWIIFSSPKPADIVDWKATAPKTGFTAPDFELETPLGEIIKLSDFRGKSVVLNFWASWCPPCRAEMPALQNIYSEYREKDVIILGVNATHNDSIVKAIEFAQLNKLTFPILFDTTGMTNKEYQINSLPTTFFINSNGVIQDVIIGGPISEIVLKSQIEELEKEN